MSVLDPLPSPTIPVIGGSAPLVRTYYLIAETSRVTDAMLRRHQAANTIKLARDLCVDWERTPRPVAIASRLADVPDDGIPCAYLEKLTAPGAAAYHDALADGRVVVYIQANADTSDQDVELSTSHELDECTVDEWCNLWAQRFLADGGLDEDALETGDPTEDMADAYAIDVNDGAPVVVSNYVTPAYFANGHRSGKRLDKRGLIKVPGECRPGGYISRISNGRILQITNPPSRKAGRLPDEWRAHPASRAARRKANAQRRISGLRMDRPVFGQ